jgi:hypothetical protein
MCIFESKEPGKTTPVDEEGDVVQVRHHYYNILVATSVIWTVG